MNKVVKTIASTTLAFGTLLGVSSAVLPVQDTAHAATQTKGITTLIMVTLIKTLNS